jgi:hypothetical protein
MTDTTAQSHLGQTRPGSVGLFGEWPPVRDPFPVPARRTSRPGGRSAAAARGGRAWPRRSSAGRIHAGRAVTVHVADTTMTINFGDDTRTVQRTTTQPVRSIKGQRPRKVAQVSRPTVKHVLGQKRQSSGGTRQAVSAPYLGSLIGGTGRRWR